MIRHLKSWRIDMTKEEAKEFYPVLRAYAEGKEIECRTKPGTISTSIPNEWTEMKEIDFWNNVEYRIKPEPTYRPFANAEECWNEMQKHQPFGWIKPKGDDVVNKFMLIDALRNEGIAVRTNIRFNYHELLEYYTFADRTPFGIIEEE